MGRVARIFRRRPASGRVPLQRSRLRLPPALIRTGTSVGVRPPLRFFASSARSTRRRSIRRTFGVGRSIVANVSRCRFRTRVYDRQPVTRSSIEKTRSPSSSGPSRGWGRCSRLVFCAPARSRRTRRSERFPRRVHLAARAGSCTDASFSAVFRYPLLRPHAALPDERSFPLSSSSGAPGVLDPSQV